MRSGRSRSASRCPSRSRARSAGRSPATSIGVLHGVRSGTRRRGRDLHRAPRSPRDQGRAPSREPTRSTTALSTTPPAWPRSSRSRRRSRAFEAPRARGPISPSWPARSRAFSARSSSRKHPPVPAGRIAAEHQHRRHRLVRKDARRRPDRPRQVLARRGRQGDREDAGPARGGRPVPGPRHVSTAPTSSASRGSACPPRTEDGHGRHREAGRLRPGAGGERTRRPTTTSRRTRSARPGISPALSRT